MPDGQGQTVACQNGADTACHQAQECLQGHGEGHLFGYPNVQEEEYGGHQGFQGDKHRGVHSGHTGMLREQEIGGVGNCAADAQKDTDVCLVGGQRAAAEEHRAHQRENHGQHAHFGAAEPEEQHTEAHGKQGEGVLQSHTDAGGNIAIGFVQEYQRCHIEQRANGQLPAKACGQLCFFELGGGNGQQNDGRCREFDKQRGSPGQTVCAHNFLDNHGDDTADHTHSDGI